MAKETITGQLTFDINSGKFWITEAEEGDATKALTMTKPGRFVSQCRFMWDGQDINSGDIKRSQKKLMMKKKVSV